MTDTVALKRLINDKGLKMCYIAKEIGVSPACLSLKLSGKYLFKSNEIVIISKILGLSWELACSIFFGEEFTKSNPYKNGGEK